MTNMSAAAVAERAVARMTEFVRVWKRRGQPAIIARVEENPAAISAPEKTLTVHDVEAVLADLDAALALVAHFVDDEEHASNLDLTRQTDVKAGREALARIRSRREGRP